MKKTVQKQVESLKKSMNGASQKSKEVIKKLVETNSKQLDSAIDSNARKFKALSETLKEKDMDTSIVSAMQFIFTNGVKLSEDTIDSVIEAHSKRLDLSIDFATKFVEALRSTDFTEANGVEKLAELVKQNMEKSATLSMDNMEKMLDIYNEHLGLALKMNKKFADNINSQIASMFEMQKKSLDFFFSLDMVSDFWKTESK